MSFKQFLIRKLMLFFTLSTLITVAVWLLGSCFDSDARFGYDAFLTPLIYAGCCGLPSLVTYSKRELKPREWLAREALQFLLTEAVVLVLAIRSRAIDTSRPGVVLGVAGSVLVIYLLVFFLLWLTNSLEAKKVNDELQRFQQLRGGDSA